MKARRSALELPAAAERWSVRSAAAAGPGQPPLQGPCPRGRIPVGPSVAPGRESEKVPRGLRACKHPAPRHTFSGLFSSFLLNSPCWSHTPGPSDRKFFLAALPKRRLSFTPGGGFRAKDARATKRTRRPPPPATRVAWSRPSSGRTSIFPQMALLWSLGSLSESRRSCRLPRTPNYVRTQYTRPFKNVKGSRGTATSRH